LPCVRFARSRAIEGDVNVARAADVKDGHRDVFKGTQAEYPEPVGPEECARLPLPCIGLLRALKHVAWWAGFRPWER
jgi:hypothetical protein